MYGQGALAAHQGCKTVHHVQAGRQRVHGIGQHIEEPERPGRPLVGEMAAIALREGKKSRERSPRSCAEDDECIMLAAAIVFKWLTFRRVTAANLRNV